MNREAAGSAEQVDTGQTDRQTDRQTDSSNRENVRTSQPTSHKLQTKTALWRERVRARSLAGPASLSLVHGQVTIIFVASVGLSVCLFVQSFSQPSLIRFRSNLDICYMSGSSCFPYNIGAVRPLGLGDP